MNLPAAAATDTEVLVLYEQCGSTCREWQKSNYLATSNDLKKIACAKSSPTGTILLETIYIPVIKEWSSQNPWVNPNTLVKNPP